ncbi:MAG: flagellar basal body P-ring formation chaperone FlgA, partial [Planctomycetaceae bacterium]|nr:flagellar basal body P-ring formation chaperone FlgA [Planctomycetaceae bacterium]
PESLVAASDPSVTPNGSNDLWLGRQKFELQCEQVSRQTGANPVVAVEANVSLPPKMVVTRHAIPRGKIITAADVSVNYVQTPVRPENVTTKRTINGVTTTRDNKTELDPDVATTLEEVVGKTPAKTFGAGMPLMVSQLQMPILVKRAETVSVYVRNDGIVIKTLGIAKQDAKSGDLIAVESIQNKKTFLARAVDLGTVEIETQRSPATGAFETVAPERTASIQNNQTY